MIALAVVLIAAVIAAIVVLASGDDSDDESVSSNSAATTQAPDTTATPETTSAPESTEAPPATDAPETTSAPETTEAPVTPELTFTIEDIEDGGTIPVDFTCDGANDPPIVTVTAVPEGTMQLALIMDDPDAPTEDLFVHWVVYGIAGDVTEITDGNDDFTYGLNDTGASGWFGPCPPPGGPHGYIFTLFALDAEIELPEDLNGRDLATAIEPAVTLETELVATYERE